MPFCENKIYYSTKNINWCIEFRNNWISIKDEYINYCKNNKLLRLKDMDEYQAPIDIGDKTWHYVLLKVYNSYTNLVSYFPKTVNLIKKIPGCTFAMFSIIEAGKMVPEHYGRYNGVLRYHLCIITDNEHPENCYIVINNIKYYWREGQDVIFDDFIPHCVANHTDSTRVVLFIDINKKFNNIFINFINELFLLACNENIYKENIIKKTNSLIK